MLAKKGPLGKIWLAAHMGEKKVPKVQVVATNIPESIQHIENPSARPRPSQRVARTASARGRGLTTTRRAGIDATAETQRIERQGE